MRAVNIQAEIFFALCKRKLVSLRKSVRVRFVDIQLIQAGVDGKVVNLHVQLIAVLFVNVRNFYGDGGRTVFHTLADRRGIFGCKLQHHFPFRIRHRIAHHKRLRVMVVVNVHIKVNALLFLVSVLIVIETHPCVL